MISLSSVTKRFKNTIAVDSIGFKARDGEIIGFVGPNGAGKTTTMRLILGYLTPTSGTITVHGHTGYLPENNPLYQDMKVREYLDFVGSLKKSNMVTESIQAIGLEEVSNKTIEELSRGFKQRVGLAAALLGNPDILVLDEPTSGLDPLEQDKIKKLIRSISGKKIVIFSTHILSEVEDIATRLIIINKGKIVFDGAKPKGKGEVEKLFKKIIK